MAPSLVQAASSVLLLAALASASIDRRYNIEVLSDISILAKRAPAPSTNLPSTWTYQGCYTDSGPRTLSGTTYANGTGMTIGSCIAFCNTQSYIYAGVEYGQECYCGNSTTAGTVAPAGDCSFPCPGNSTEACGAGNRLSVYWNGKAPPAGPSTNPGVGGYGFLGCYTEGNGGRALAQGQGVTGLTVAKCVAACSAANLPYAGVEYGGECYCDTALKNGAVVAPGGLADCNMLCNGNSSEYCGAGNRLNVYKLGYGGSSSTVSSVSLSTTTSVGSTSQVSLTTRSSSSSSLSSTKISTTSTSRSLSSTGSSRVSTSSSTSRSVTSTSSSTRATSTSSSKSSTSANTSTSKSSTVSVTTTPPVSTSASASASPTPTLGVKPTVGSYSALGCYTEATNGRALNGAAFFDNTLMTLEYCASKCAAYTYWGVEYGQECYCGNTLAPGSVQANIADCSFTCPGNKYEYCGAGNRLQLYKLGPVATPTGTSTPSSSIIVSTSATSTQSSTATGLPAGWKYAGCYSEGTNGRALANQRAGGNANTIESCIADCVSAGYTVAGLEYSSQCFCDNNLKNGAAPVAATRCNMACAGNPNEVCGSGDILSIYNTGNLTVYAPPASQSKGLPGSWVYQGCYSDANNGNRALFWQSILTTNNTATSCLSLCQEYGYMAAGMEYGDECFCGDHAKLVASGSVQVAESQCNTACSGDPSYFCGSGARLSYYRWDTAAPPLYVWNTPTGAGAGSYTFLIGGVVVPLITTLGINNKIIVQEKGGTGVANATGTYELDLAFIDDFSKAWRPLHVKTDIFCAAGVTLPDKAGRQMTIGGWSGPSTYGVRIYTPDGSPGVLGVNDWQENVNEVSLLAGRWYPSAMIMTNGSVLIIGGETGSNSAAVPTLEILPPPAKGYEKYLDWLDRTDPNNLYPFLWVLPSGGIFVVYWNEARIIDEVTFDTIKVLPNMPGSVINFLAGRTYPLEGTGVLLPQYPPYSEPVTVLVCGGSAAGAAVAIDNCVSTQPEVAKPTWTIERMPSQRVMSCICALPDGTYLILNGATAGVAGFGLATNPNLGAVLYDPSKPVNQRMSIMATTIVARMYHSEAILLPDGRVLVSGSDPEDGVNPQEYRNEVFNPPYTLSGQAAPSFTLNNKDWAYGVSTVKATAKIPSGNLGTVRASMLAAVSSTHGNSMGQRTLFLTVSCTGPATAATCTITTPPTAHVAPPGWYQIFLLDGAMPSTSVWARVGGSIADAAGLGNWPKSTTFTTPGLGPVAA